MGQGNRPILRRGGVVMAKEKVLMEGYLIVPTSPFNRSMYLEFLGTQPDKTLYLYQSPDLAEAARNKMIHEIAKNVRITRVKIIEY